jgi:protease-4
MVGDRVRLLAAVASIPGGAVARGVRRWGTGSAPVIDIEVKRLEDGLERAALLELLGRIALAPHVVGVLLRVSAPPGGWAACQDLREAIEALRDAGKCVYAWLESPGNAAMWLAAGCDRVFLLRTGEVGLLGVGAELTFFGAALERFGLKADFVAAGAYKSFGESYTRSFASVANREAMGAIVADLHGQLLQGIAAGRGLTAEALAELVARAPLSAEEAADAGLVDQLAYTDELERWIEERHGEGSRLVSVDTWARLDGLCSWTDTWGAKDDAVVVLHLEGAIVMDDRRAGTLIRARKVASILRGLREDDRVRAVVLHVNSPGGSALASDVIWREVELLQREKPVVAAFGDVAASGGYYLAAPVAEIVARPGTLTGSIGVFGGKLVAREGLRRLGVHAETVAAAPNTGVYSPTQAFTDAQRERFRGSMQRVYDGFVDRVAAGRRRPVDAVEPHCRGRVWTGQAALERGLVDRIGGIDVAVERARSLAGLSPHDCRRLDASVQPARSMLSRAVADAMRAAAPMGVLAFAEKLVGRVAGGAVPVLQLVAEHEAQPLALLPFVVDPLRR